MMIDMDPKKAEFVWNEGNSYEVMTLTPTSNARHTQKLRITVYKGNDKYDGEYTIHIRYPNGEVEELMTSDNPEVIEGLRPYTHYTVWVSTEEEASYPTDVYLYRTGGKVIAPPGCHISPKQMAGEYNDVKVKLGKRRFLFLIQTQDLRPARNATIILENYYTGEQFIAGTTDEHGRLWVKLPYGRYYVTVQHGSGMWDLAHTIRVRDGWRPLLLMILR